MESMTLHEDRPISRQEIEIVSWLLRNASTKEPLNHLLDGIDRLRVVGRCGCGCASVDFEKDGHTGARRWNSSSPENSRPTASRHGEAWPRT